MDGVRTYFLYSDEGLVAEYDESGNELRSYGWQPDSTWGTDPLWLKEDGEYYWYQNDHLGTPQKLVDSSGTVVWSAAYTAFGEAQVSVETVTNNLRFPGQYYDAETGLHYNLNRYYEPEIGRYAQTDPIGVNTDEINIYAFVGNNPVRWADPLGLFKSNDWLRAVVPGQKFFDYAMTAFENGHYFEGAMGITDMLGEQVLFVTLLGQSSVVQQGIACALEAGPGFAVGVAEAATLPTSGFNLTGQLKTIWANRRLFLNWLKANQSLTRVSNPLTHMEARQILDNAKKLGLSIDLNTAELKGLEVTGQWAGIPHFKVGSVHIPVDLGFIP